MLLESVPRINGFVDKENFLHGELPDNTKKYQGCHFALRCKNCTQECKDAYPEEINFSETHKASCFLYK